MKPSLTILYFLFITNFLTAQPGTFYDTRDGNTYKTIRINGKTWFREHLRYKTSKSYYPNINKDTTNLYLGNYYSHTELESLCPAGWRLATIDDLEEYINLLPGLYNIPETSIFRTYSNNVDSSFLINMSGYDPMSDTLMQFYSIGWVEGRKIHQKSLSMWIKDNRTRDGKFHAHIGKLGYVIHTHEHNIIDKPKRIRQFVARCVCEN